MSPVCWVWKRIRLRIWVLTIHVQTFTMNLYSKPLYWNRCSFSIAQYLEQKTFHTFSTRLSWLICKQYFLAESLLIANSAPICTKSKTLISVSSFITNSSWSGCLFKHWKYLLDGCCLPGYRSKNNRSAA